MSNAPPHTTRASPEKSPEALVARGEKRVFIEPRWPVALALGFFIVITIVLRVAQGVLDGVKVFTTAHNAAIMTVLLLTYRSEVDWRRDRRSLAVGWRGLALRRGPDIFVRL